MNIAVLSQVVDRIENRYFGKYRGQVVDNADPENRGRLRVRVPGVLGPDVVSGWAMPCVPYGGSAGQGFLFVPEIDAGVWVEFECGQLEYPIWVGTFWCSPGGTPELPTPSQPAGAPEDEPQSPPTRKIIRTVKGHTLQFEDKDGDEQIILVDGQNGHVVLLNADGISITDGANGHTVILDSNGVKVEDASGNKIETTSSGMTLLSDGDIALKGANVKIESTSGDVKITSAAGVTMEATATTTIKGAMVEIN